MLELSQDILVATVIQINLPKENLMGIKFEDVIEAAEAKFGSNSVMSLTKRNKVKVACHKTGIPQLDIALGGGIPKGRVIEIYGPESSGKTTLALTIIARAQKESNAWAWYGDMEHALDPEWAVKQGVNLDRVMFSQPMCGEECLDIAQWMAGQGVVDFLVVDSVAALVPKAELEGQSGDAVMGLQARLMSQAMRKLTSVLSRTQSTAIFINQLRDKIGVQWGSPETTTGGKALKFYASQRIDIRRIGNTKGKNDEVIGSDHKMKVVKNKIAPPFKMCEASLLYEIGFDLYANLLETGVSKGVFVKDKNTYKHGDVKLGVGIKAGAEGLSKYSKEDIDALYAKIVGIKIKIEEPKPEIDLAKETLAKYKKKLEEVETDEERALWEARIKDLIENGVIAEEEPVIPTAS